ncbi:hypothetical protein [Chromobacterium sphagni]|uniref:Uncharacterized protein n=1 Tax=Chromobacterium sphagni TaxID=1903179 RepID=A0ABX3CD56_9NEIS|nr:hypothetical protein [Chromobacterium sphagni]OHX20215.1 hypothetical protein BI344_06880 [Chromobacterium sphagni]
MQKKMENVQCRKMAAPRQENQALWRCGINRRQGCDALRLRNQAALLDEIGECRRNSFQETIE